MKKWISILLSLAMLLSLMACAKTESEPQPTVEPEPVSEPEETEPEPEAEPESEVEETPSIDWTGINPLTGEPTQEEDTYKRRPVMVMLNNLKQALPQSGNGQADVIYEILEEGGITRMLAVYQDITQVEGNLGSIRSTRPYYVYLVAGLDGFLVHAGGSGAAYNAIESLYIDDLDALSGPAASLFWRDKNRLNSGYATEHTMYITASDIADYLKEMPIRTRHTDEWANSVDRTFVEDATPADGSAANVITVPFSGYKTGEFKYDPDTGKYLVSEFGSAYMDEAQGKQVSVKNVLIVMTEVSRIEGDTKGRINVAMEGSGIGYFACGGKYIPINWSRETETSPYVFTTMDGEPLVLGIGNSYVNIVPTTCSVSFVG